MTPRIFLAILLVLAGVLVFALRSIWVEFSAGRNKKSVAKKAPVKAQVRRAAKPTREPKTLSKPAVVPSRERKRSLVAQPVAEAAYADGEITKAGFYNSIERQLEHAFELLSEGRIEIPTYKKMILAELSASKRHRAVLRSKELAGSLIGDKLLREHADLDQAVVAIEWCLAWTSRQRERTPSPTFKEGNVPRPRFAIEKA